MDLDKPQVQPSQRLTPRQREVLEHIESFISIHGYAPTFREIMQHFNLSSVGTVYRLVQALQQKGALTNTYKQHRSLNPVSSLNNHEVAIPFIGYVNSEMTIEMFAQSQTITIPKSYVTALEKTYALQVKGNALLEDLIADGDFLILEARSEASPGNTVIIQTHSHELIMRKYYPEGAQVHLTSSGIHHKPLVIPKKDLVIHGILQFLLRRF